MKDYYAILGVSKKASLSDIKKAHKVLSLSNHPDRGGTHEGMTEINEAYVTLSDPQQRLDYDEKWKFYNLSTDTTPEDIAGLLPTAGIHYSNGFKQQHKLLAERYKKEPLKAQDARANLKLVDESSVDILSRIKNKGRNTSSNFNKIWSALTPAIACNVFQDFLDEKHYGAGLIELAKEFSGEVKKIKDLSRSSMPEIMFYEAIHEIIAMTISNASIGENLANAMQKITDYAIYHANQAEDNLSSMLFMTLLVRLVSSKSFRALFAFGLKHYWAANADALDQSHLQLFNGCDAAKKLIEKCREKLASSESRKFDIKILRLFHLLYRLEKHLSKYPNHDTDDYAKFYREKGYSTLDWIPALAGLVSQNIIVNIFIQAGMCFQKASRNEVDPAIKMADEKLAYRVYLTAFSIGHKANPDVELYTNVHILKCLTQFMYANDELKKVISDLLNRTARLSDTFPFYPSSKSNIAFIEHEGQLLVLMRHLLHALIAISESKRPDESKILDHTYVKILEETYSACLKNWYEMQYNRNTEESVRLKLMQELLRINHWTFVDIDRLLRPKDTTSLKRDSMNWIDPTRALSLPAQHSYFTTINEIEINNQTGTVSMGCRSWKEGDSTYSKLFTELDLIELFRHNTTAAILSLDPPDRDMEYHPFNKIRFAPSSLYESQLLHTMFLTDYLLKFLTVGREVQGTHPYALRSVDELIKILPKHLQKIIQDFHASASSGSTHRFWIEAENVPITINKDQLEKTGKVTIIIGNVQMLVKKHKMVRNIDGELVDEENNEEGWNIYVLNQKQIKEVKLGKRIVISPAIICVENYNAVFFLEDDTISQPYSLKKNDHILRRLYKLPRETDGRILVKDNQSQRLIFTLTNEITKQAGKPNRFSPEYTFSQEFSKNYDVFSIYFPEFGRLRELSKAVAVARVLENFRLDNLLKIDKINKNLRDDEYWKKVRGEIKPLVQADVRQNFQNWHHFSTKKLSEKRRESLDDVLKQIGKLKYTSDSAEIRKIIADQYIEAERDIKSKYSHAAWVQNSQKIRNQLESAASELAQTLTQRKFDNCIQQLRELFKHELSGLPNYSITEMLTTYLHQGYSTQLLTRLVSYDESQVLKQIQEVYPKQNLSTLRDALNNSTHAIDAIVNERTEAEIEKIKQNFIQQLRTLEKLDQTFTDMGFSKSAEDVDLEKVCLWVPASVYHEVDTDHVRTVYGGVSIGGGSTVASFHGIGNSGNPIYPGLTVYRVWGGGSGPNGASWTTVNPNSVPNLRDAAGLPNVNTGRFVSQGVIYNTSNALLRSALPLDGNTGGLPELVIKDTKSNVTLTRVSGVNPPF